jgi:hypothetical protein
MANTGAPLADVSVDVIAGANRQSETHTSDVHL